MVRGDRIAALMSDLGLTQAELARRVGVKQPTIFGLIHQNKTGSVHLHKVARELGTTPAYLSGETDDPTSQLPDEPELTAEERGLVDCLRLIQSKDRAALIQLARSLAGVCPEPTMRKRSREAALSETVHDSRPSFGGG
jgi:transcriptional regulator with XRE-family HTH domain